MEVTQENVIQIRDASLVKKIENFDAALTEMMKNPKSIERAEALNYLLEIYDKDLKPKLIAGNFLESAKKLDMEAEKGEIHLMQNIREFSENDSINPKRISDIEEKAKAVRFLGGLKFQIIPRLKRHGMIENADEVEKIIVRMGASID